MELAVGELDIGVSDEGVLLVPDELEVDAVSLGGKLKLDGLDVLEGLVSLEGLVLELLIEDCVEVL